MAKRIIWSLNALADRIEILEYWYQRIGNKIYSKKLDSEMKKIIQSISEFPELGRKMDKLEIRYVIKKDYQIFYEFKGNEIHLLHIWDARRNPEDLKI